MILRLLCGQMQIIAEVGHLIVKGRIIGEDPHRILIDLKPAFHRFNGDRLISIRKDPVER